MKFRGCNCWRLSWFNGVIAALSEDMRRICVAMGMSRGNDMARPRNNKAAFDDLVDDRALANDPGLDDESVNSEVTGCFLSVSDRVINEASDGMLMPTRCKRSPRISLSEIMAWIAVISTSLKAYGLGLFCMACASKFSGSLLLLEARRLPRFALPELAPLLLPMALLLLNMLPTALDMP